MPSIPRKLLLAFVFVFAFGQGQAADDLSGIASGSYPPGYVAIVREAMRAFAARDFEAAIKLVDKADLTFQVTPVALNIRGAIAIEEKKYDEGRDLCLKAIQRDPRFYPARFNLCEIQFVQGKYAEARALFQNLRESYPSDDLLKFRIFLTYLLEKDETMAKQYLDSTPLIGTSPVYYYTQAAWEFAHGNPAEGKRWLKSGYNVFSPARHLNYIDVFYDLGWLERPQAQKPEE